MLEIAIISDETLLIIETFYPIEPHIPNPKCKSFDRQ